jgi:2-keto-3-deoxy-L-rhamnonate aldolase RhmA
MIVRLVRGNEIAAIAQSSGYDALYIDMEHNSFSIEVVAQMCQGALPLGIAPIVRVPSIASEFIPRVLEGGALGIIAPHVQTASDAKAVVDAALFPPIGHRSLGGPIPHLRFRSYPAGETMAAVNDATFIVAMIESEGALQNIDEIAAVDGIDMLLVGTNDLCTSLGIPGQPYHSIVRETYEKVLAACKRHNKHVGIGGLASQPDLIADFIGLGARWVSVGSDVGFLIAESSGRAKQIRQAAQTSS